MKNKATLSVVLAVRNEEAFLGDCLKSVQGLADEIIVFDESSTDNTRQIAKKYGARVFIARHEPIFHVTKNKAIKKATGDWVLQLDADERLTTALRLEIKALLSGTAFGYDSWLSPLRRLLPFFKSPQPLVASAAAYWLPRRNFFLDRYLKHTGQYPDPVIRLFQRGKAILPAKDVHEQMKVDGPVGWLRVDLDHYATPDFSRYLKRENDYSSLEAQHLYEKGVKITVFNTLNYLFLKPCRTFCSLYFRYRGFLDGFPGFVFSLYSGFHHAFAYMKLWELYQDEKN